MTVYVCWLVTLLFSIFEVSFTDGIIVHMVLLKKSGSDAPCTDQMEITLNKVLHCFQILYISCCFNCLIMFFQLAYLIGGEGGRGEGGGGELDWRLCAWNFISHYCFLSISYDFWTVVWYNFFGNTISGKYCLITNNGALLWMNVYYEFC